MKWLKEMAVALTGVVCTTVALAQGPQFGAGPGNLRPELGAPVLLGQTPSPAVPVPEPYPLPGAPVATMPPADGTPIPQRAVDCELFDCVKYKDLRNIAPCAVPMVVSVKDPCACIDPCDCRAAPKCVNVKICVPPCGCPDVKLTRNGNKVKYDYGKYVIEITSRKGIVVVDYDTRLLHL